MKKLGLLVLLGLAALASPAKAQNGLTQQCVASAYAGGTSDAITIPALPCALSTNLLILDITATNVTASPTLQPLGLPAQPIVSSTGGAVGVGVLAAGSRVLLTPNGTQWLVVGGGAGSGAVSTVSNSDGTLVISPVFGSVIVSLNLAQPNTWTANQTFPNASINLTKLTPLGSANQCLTMNGGGTAIVWANCLSSITLTVGTTPISGAGASAILYNNSNLLGAQTTGSGVLAALGNGINTTNGIATSAGATSFPNLTTIGTVTTGIWNSNPPTLQYGGTGANLSATGSTGGIVWLNGSALSIINGTVTAGQCLLSANVAAPTWGSCTGSAAVSSVTAADSTLTITPTTGAVTAKINLGQANTWSANQTFPSASIALSVLSGLGTNVATALGQTLNGTNANSLVSYSATTLPSLVSVGTLTTGVWNATPVTYPYGGTGLSALGSPNQCLTTNGAASAMTWQNCSSSVTLTIGGTTIASGINGYLLYNNAGVLGNSALGTGVLTALGNNLNASGGLQGTVTFGTGAQTALSNPVDASGGFVTYTGLASPPPIGGTTPNSGVFTSVITPTLYGGTNANSVLSLRSTSNGSPSGDSVTVYTGGIQRQVYTSSGAIGIGTETNPQVALVVSGNTKTGLPAAAGSQGLFVAADNVNTQLEVDSYGASASPNITFRAAGGTGASPSAVAINATLGNFSFRGYTGSGFSGQNVIIQGFATENWTASANGSAVLVKTVRNGTLNSSIVLTVDGNGHINSGLPAGTSIGISACGTSPSTANGTDVSGQITEGTTATGCTVTFANGFGSAPICTVTAQSALTSFAYTVSSTQIVVTHGSASGAKLNWMCAGV